MAIGLRAREPPQGPDLAPPALLETKRQRRAFILLLYSI